MIVRLVSSLLLCLGSPSRAREEGELAGQWCERDVSEPARLRAPGLGKIEEILSVWFIEDATCLRPLCFLALIAIDCIIYHWSRRITACCFLLPLS
jgi:hypothetical protein